MNNDRTTKNDILLALLREDSGVALSDAVEQSRRMFNELHDEYEELEDLSSGPQDMSLGEALNKVAFEIKNDRSLAGQIRQLFSSVTYDKLMKRLKIEDPRAEESTEIIKLADQLAVEMLDSFETVANLRNKDIN